VKRKEVLEQIEGLLKAFKVTNGDRFSLDKFDPADTRHLKSEDKRDSKELLARGVEWVAELQDKLYAQDRWSILLIFQAIDAAGKDGTIKHVMSGVNPQGVQVYSFKQPSQEELNHDYLWRYSRCLPERGRIGIFNRSYYEEVLVVRVHKEILANQRIPEKLISKNIWSERLEDIRSFESYLVRNGIVPVKFFLHLSREEQTKRLLARLDRPEKNWKFSAADLHERDYWDSYTKAFEEAIKATATKQAPWYVIPADNKWFTRLAVAAAVVEVMEKLDLAYPTVSKQQRKELEQCRQTLLEE
jgi:PPK2 family polyphosphate:nucleotide phosphotransferase